MTSLKLISSLYVHASLKKNSLWCSQDFRSLYNTDMQIKFIPSMVTVNYWLKHLENLFWSKYLNSALDTAHSLMEMISLRPPTTPTGEDCFCEWRWVYGFHYIIEDVMHITGDQGPLAVSIGLQDAALLTSALLALLACKDERRISGNMETALFWHRAWWLSLPDSPFPWHPLVGSL